MDPQRLKTQTGLFLQLDDVRRAAAAYELMYEAVEMLKGLPIPVLEGLRDYAKEQLKCRHGPLVLCERAYVEHLDELIRGAKHQEKLLFRGITGSLDNDEDKNEDGKGASAQAHRVAPGSE
jgi:anaerobic glycerol-3-phosphate dehydrogenase